MNKIIVLFDYTSNEGLSYVEVLERMEKQEPLIITNCLDFFSFASMDKGYDVEVKKSNGDYIILSELLTDEENVYTRKMIRKAHDTRKLLIANAFNFKNNSQQAAE